MFASGLTQWSLWPSNRPPGPSILHSILKSLNVKEKETRGVILSLLSLIKLFLILCFCLLRSFGILNPLSSSWALSACSGSSGHGKQVHRTGPTTLSSITRQLPPNLSVTPISLPSNPVRKEKHMTSVSF